MKKLIAIIFIFSLITYLNYTVVNAESPVTVRINNNILFVDGYLTNSKSEFITIIAQNRTGDLLYASQCKLLNDKKFNFQFTPKCDLNEEINILLTPSNLGESKFSVGIIYAESENTNTAPSYDKPSLDIPKNSSKDKVISLPALNVINSGKEENNDVPAPFSDIAEHWSYKYINIMYSEGLILGSNDKEFKPDNKITRAEFATIIARTFKTSEASYKNIFADVNSNDWYSNYIQICYENKIIDGYENKFRPNDLITREELCKIAVETYKVKTGNNEINIDGYMSFNDAEQISQWAIKYIKLANSLELIKGDESKNFNPRNHSTRAEAIKIISRILSLL